MRKSCQPRLADPLICPHRKQEFSVGPLEAPNKAIRVRVLALRGDRNRKSTYKSVWRSRSLNFPSDDLFATNTLGTVDIGENRKEPSRLCRYGGVGRG